MDILESWRSIKFPERLILLGFLLSILLAIPVFFPKMVMGVSKKLRIEELSRFKGGEANQTRYYLDYRLINVGDVDIKGDEFDPEAGLETSQGTISKVYYDMFNTDPEAVPSEWYTTDHYNWRFKKLLLKKGEAMPFTVQIQLSEFEQTASPESLIKWNFRLYEIDPPQVVSLPPGANMRWNGMDIGSGITASQYNNNWQSIRHNEVEGFRTMKEGFTFTSLPFWSAVILGLILFIGTLLLFRKRHEAEVISIRSYITYIVILFIYAFVFAASLVSLAIHPAFYFFLLTIVILIAYSNSLYFLLRGGTLT